MRNLKKLLSLFMALAMAFSLTVVSASALSSDFTDSDTLNHNNAVDVLTELGVLAGYLQTDGTYTFDGEKTITRAELAKIIAVALSGGKDPLLDATAPSNFSDCPANFWANPYIAFCVNLGILHGGTGVGGKFRPNDPVTVGEATKVMLVAIGFNAEVAGLVGSNWLTNAMVKANLCDPKLLDGIEGVAPTDPLSRDNAAQMLFNMIRTGMKAYDIAMIPDSKGGVTTEYREKDFTHQIGGTDVSWTILSYHFGVDWVVGVIVANEEAGLDVATAGDTDITPTAFPRTAIKAGTTLVDVRSNGVVTGSLTVQVSTDMDMLGLEVDLYVKRVNNLWTVFGKPIPTGNNNISIVPAGSVIYDYAIRDAGVRIEDSTLVNVKYNINTESVLDTLVNFTNRITGSATDTYKNIKAQSGFITKIIDNNGTGIADVAVVMFYLDYDGNAIGDKETDEVAEQYALITEAYISQSGSPGADVYKVKAYLANGKSGVFDVNVKSRQTNAITNELDDSAPVGIPWKTAFPFATDGTASPDGYQTAKNAPLIARYTVDSSGVLTLFDPVRYVHNTTPNTAVIARGQIEFNSVHNTVATYTNGAAYNTATDTATDTKSVIANRKTVVFYVTNTNPNPSAPTAAGAAEYIFSTVNIGSSIFEVSSGNNQGMSMIVDDWSKTNPAIKCAVISTGNPVRDSSDSSDSSDIMYAYISGNPAGNQGGDVTVYNALTYVDGTLAIRELKTKNPPSLFASTNSVFATYIINSDGYAEFTPIANVVNDAATACYGVDTTSYEDGTVTFNAVKASQVVGHYRNRRAASVDSRMTVYRVENKGDATKSNALTADGAIKNNYDVLERNLDLLINKDGKVVMAISTIKHDTKGYNVNYPVFSDNGLTANVTTTPVVTSNVPAGVKVAISIDVFGVPTTPLVGNSNTLEITIKDSNGTPVAITGGSLTAPFGYVSPNASGSLAVHFIMPEDDVTITQEWTWGS